MISKVTKVISLFLFASIASSLSALADQIPDCLGTDGSVLAIDNQQVLDWKTSTPNQFEARAHVSGVIDQVYPDHSGHHHFEISMGGDPSATLEVIYNEDFGPNPQAQVGMQVEACGDYITSTASSGPYPESPAGAIIHWVHMSPNLEKHPSGFMVLNGQVCGQDTENAGPKQYPQPRRR